MYDSQPREHPVWIVNMHSLPCQSQLGKGSRIGLLDQNNNGKTNKKIAQ
jgi:hypothetical protein